MSDQLTLIIRKATGLVVSVAVGVPGDVLPPDGCETILRAGSAADAWEGWIRKADGSFAQPQATVPVVSPVIIVAKVDFYRRCTESEADQIQGALANTSNRMQGIFGSAVNFRSDAEEWPMLHEAAVALFGDDRANVLLASSA